VLLKKQLNEEDFRQRAQDYDEKKKLKLLQRQEETKDKDLEGCTFKPVLVTGQAGQVPKRNLDQFLEDQKKFTERVNKKLEDKKNVALEGSVIMNPSIDLKSKQIIEEKMADRKNKATYDRLYELDKEK
jgi:hypothetical protein